MKEWLFFFAFSCHVLWWNLSENKRKYIGKMTAEKLKIIILSQQEGKEYHWNSTGLWNSALHTVDLLEKSGLCWKQALHGTEVSKQMIMHGARHSNLKGEHFYWFCHAQSNNNIPVEGPMVREKTNEITWRWESDISVWIASAIQAVLEHHMASL